MKNRSLDAMQWIRGLCGIRFPYSVRLDTGYGY